MNKQSLISKYFSQKAPFYDEVDKQPYWLFSDKLLWGLLNKLILPKEKKSSIHLLDMGTGTARWSKKFLENYPNSSAEIVDLSKEMLSLAKDKLDQHKLLNRVKIIEADITNLNMIKDASCDLIFCFHNVLGFVSHVPSVLREVKHLLTEGGSAALMFPNYYHALYFSLLTGRLSEVQRIIDENQVCFTNDMPPLKVFKLLEIESMIKQSGLSLRGIFGFPVTLYPGMAETTLRDSTNNLKTLLDNEKQNKWLYDLEFSLCLDPVLAPRGNNLLAIVS